MVNGQAEIDTTKFDQGIQRMERGVRNVGRASSDAGADASKKFGELNGIFGGLLPRNMQSMIRRFQSTSRAVRRAGKSMSVFKKSIIALGLPALLVVLGEIIANWEAISDALGFTSEESRQLAKEQDQLTSVMLQATAATEPYLDVIQNLNNSLEDRQVAQKELSRSVQSAAGIDLEATDAVERLTAATANYIAQQETQKQLALVQEKINKKREEQANAELSWVAIGYSEQGKANAQAKLRAELEEQIMPLEAERAKIIEQQIELQKELNEELETQREEREAEAEALREQKEAERALEAQRKQEQQEKEARQKREADAIERLTKSEEQRGMTEEELFLDELDRNERAELATVQSEEAKEAIKEFYAQKWLDYYADLVAKEEADQAAKDEREKARVEKVEKDITKELEKTALERRLADMSAEEAELEKNRLHYEALKEQAKSAGLDTFALLKEELIQKELIQDKYDAIAIEKEEALQEALYRAKERAVGEGADLLGKMANIAEEGSDSAKAFAITEVLLNQAIAMSNAIKGATGAAATPPTPATPFLQAGYIISMVGGVVSSFASIKRILDDAGSGGTAGVGSGGSRARQPSQALVPNQNLDVQNNEAQNVNVSAFVVQSQLQGTQLDQASAMARATL